MEVGTVARVFISYRRADGQYAVGWIEERLRREGSGVGDVQTAFRDSDLRYGEDFPARLAREVEQCDVLIAVIGPNWRGAQPDGRDRILEPADWVGREITRALETGTRIVPVLLTGVEPLHSSELLPAHAAFADLHAVRFDEAGDLEELVDAVRHHLEEIDRADARTQGLETAISVPALRPSLRVLVTAVLAAVGGGVLGWLSTRLSEDSGVSADIGVSTVWTTVEVGAWAGLGVLGVAFFRRTLSGLIEVPLQRALATLALATVLVALTVIAFIKENDERVRTLIDAFLALTLLSPWIVMLIGPAWAKSSPLPLGARVQALAVQRRALSVATPVAGFALGIAVAATANKFGVDEWTGDERTGLIGLGILVSLIVAGGVEYGHASLRQQSERVEGEVDKLAAEYRQHALPVLISGRSDLWWSPMGWAMAPTAVAVVAVLVSL